MEEIKYEKKQQRSAAFSAIIGSALSGMIAGALNTILSAGASVSTPTEGLMALGLAGLGL